jgi:hypothetical protein
MMTPEEKLEFENMKRAVADLTEFMILKKQHQITYPFDDASRKIIGVGFIARGSETTPAGSILVNSNEGPLKLLYAT